MKIWALFIISISVGIVHAMDNPHFYRATNLFQEPRLTLACLTSFDGTIAGGSTQHGRNGAGKTVPLFDIYGTNNIQQLGVGVPGKELTSAQDLLLIELARAPGRLGESNRYTCPYPTEFAHLSIKGNFNLLESNLSFMQNLEYGLFFQVHLPIRRIKIDSLCFCDLSPTDTMCPNATTPLWETFKQQFDAILGRYHLVALPFSKTGVGDTSILLGWSFNYEDTEILDYIDAMIKAGILAPTGALKNQDQLFSLPLGYNGHVGFPLTVDLGFGLYDWVTLAVHFDALLFVHRTYDLRIKTGFSQSGIIKLAKTETRVCPGSLWNAGILLKADHLCRGFSATIGYSFARQEETTLTLCNTSLSTSIANSDAMLKGFKMHTLHILLEYDITKEESIAGARFGFFYNKNIGGERIFKTSMIGGSCGIDITWSF